MSKQLQRIKKELHNPATERLVIAGILQHGKEIYYDVATIIQSESFYLPENKLVFGAISHLISEKGINKPDIVGIIAYISNIDKEAVSKYQLTDYLNILIESPVNKDEVKVFSGEVQRYFLARSLKGKLAHSIDLLDSLSGKETVTEIISIAEKPIADFTCKLINDDTTIKIGESIEGFLDHIINSDGVTPGISSGFPRFDKFIGGGLRRSGVHLIGARTGVGKSHLAVNVANNLDKSNIKVLYLDTELTPNMIMTRWLAVNSGVSINDIEYGKFKNSPAEEVLKDWANKLKKSNFYYHNISDKHHQDWLTVMRRWIMKEVGFNQNGTTNDCLIIVDYIKLMNVEHTGDFAEYQYLGQIITDLHNFALKYDIPIMALAQLNRDGISNEDQGVFAGSDRLIQLCSSASILKNKAPEDIADDPKVNGDKKLITVKTRFGPGTSFGEYINIKCNLEYGLMQEGNTNIENRQKVGLQYDASNDDGQPLII